MMIVLNNFNWLESALSGWIILLKLVGVIVWIGIGGRIAPIDGCRGGGPIAVAQPLMPYAEVVKALYAYEALASDELSFAEDELLCVIESRDDDWLLARPLQDVDRCGLVPANYVEPLEEIETLTTLYEYVAQEDNELGFNEGETLFLLSKIDTDWWLVRNDSFQFGLIPANYVEEEKVSPPEDGNKDVFIQAPESNVDEISFSSSPTTLENNFPSAKQTKEWSAEFLGDERLKGKLVLLNGATLIFVHGKEKIIEFEYDLNDILSYDQKYSKLTLKDSQSQVPILVGQTDGKELSTLIKDYNNNNNNRLSLLAGSTLIHDNTFPFEEPADTFSNTQSQESFLNEHSSIQPPTESSPLPFQGGDCKDTLGKGIIEEQQEQGLSTHLDKVEESLSEEEGADLVLFAQYDYIAKQQDELGVTEGERVLILDDSSEDWWLVAKVYDKTRQGFVPKSYLASEYFPQESEEQISNDNQGPASLPFLKELLESSKRSNETVEQSQHIPSPPPPQGRGKEVPLTKQAISSKENEDSKQNPNLVIPLAPPLPGRLGGRKNSTSSKSEGEVEVDGLMSSPPPPLSSPYSPDMMMMAGVNSNTVSETHQIQLKIPPPPPLPKRPNEITRTQPPPLPAHRPVLIERRGESNFKLSQSPPSLLQSPKISLPNKPNNPNNPNNPKAQSERELPPLKASGNITVVDKDPPKSPNVLTTPIPKRSNSNWATSTQSIKESPKVNGPSSFITTDFKSKPQLKSLEEKLTSTSSSGGDEEVDRHVPTTQTPTKAANPWAAVCLRKADKRSVMDKSGGGDPLKMTSVSKALPSRPDRAASDNKPSPAETRLWKDKSGKFQTEAAFLSFDKITKAVQIHKLNGHRISVPFEMLSERDMEYVTRRCGITASVVASPEKVHRHSFPKNYSVNGFDWLQFLIQSGINSESAADIAEQLIVKGYGEKWLEGLNRGSLKATLRISDDDSLLLIQGITRLRLQRLESSSEQKLLLTLKNSDKGFNADRGLNADKGLNADQGLNSFTSSNWKMPPKLNDFAVASNNNNGSNNFNTSKVERSRISPISLIKPIEPIKPLSLANSSRRNLKDIPTLQPQNPQALSSPPLYQEFSTSGLVPLPNGQFAQQQTTTQYLLHRTNSGSIARPMIPSPFTSNQQGRNVTNGGGIPGLGFQAGSKDTGSYNSSQRSHLISSNPNIAPLFYPNTVSGNFHDFYPGMGKVSQGPVIPKMAPLPPRLPPPPQGTIIDNNNGSSTSSRMDLTLGTSTTLPSIEATKATSNNHQGYHFLPLGGVKMMNAEGPPPPLVNNPLVVDNGDKYSIFRTVDPHSPPSLLVNKPSIQPPPDRPLHSNFGPSNL